MGDLDTLMRKHFLEYASYSILDRAIPDIRDGLKPVQRRILHTLFRMNDGRYHKVANVIGDTMKLHPHGDASIGDALVVLANKDFFIDRQGNFGNPITGHPAAAARYIECRLTPLALETLFFEPLTEFVDSYDGRNQEPVFLPSKLPVALMLGAEGIAVGMATRILPHNLKELWEAQIEILEGNRVELFPDFQQGGLMDVDAYEDGRGKVEVRARLKTLDEKRIVIQEIPFGTTTESLIASIEGAVQKGRIKVSSIQDFTTDKVEIELTLSRGVRPKEVLPELFAYSDCSISVSSNLTIIRDRRPVELTVTEVLEQLTDRLQDQIKLELEYERDQLIDKQHWLTLEQIFVEKRVYKQIEEAETSEAVRDAVWNGMHEWEDLFVRPMVEEDVKRLLEVRIRRISAFDIEKNREQIAELEKDLKALKRRLKNVTKSTIQYIQGLIDRYGDQFPRRTEITRIEAVDKKKVARQNIKVAYDAESGFFGSGAKGDKFPLTVSEFDLILAISSDGTYRVMSPQDKVLISGKMIHCQIFDPEQGAEFTVVYRDKQKTAFAKRIEISKFIRNREYQLIKGRAGRVDVLLEKGQTGKVDLDFVPAKRQRLKTADFDLSQLEIMGTTARGVRLAPKPVAKVKFTAQKPPAPKPSKKPASKKPASKKKAPPPEEGGQGSLF